MEKTSTRPGTALFEERLSPSPAVHLLSLLVGGGAALAASAWGVVPAVVAGVLGVVGTSVLLVLSSPVVRVVAGGDPADGGDPRSVRLHAGRAVIPVEALGPAEILDADGVRRVMGVDADLRAWVCQRSWVRSGVRVPVVDERDATPYWLVCTRRPAQLVAALGRR
ncbi:DUF3093 domain-containing protein [Georgenia subflava]|uniref:DUF3093 family protein n=1 Tax=Georgenia subflava TaxID=1622177 RepID=A0A6N7EN66_9MICO|nr:DUF3093 domain-containing protein [Georgenia subflava]MPV38568.1 DUF3093 family protein [Georgenia subflava]